MRELRPAPVSYVVGKKRHYFSEGGLTACGLRWEAAQFTAFGPHDRTPHPGQLCERCRKAAQKHHAPMGAKGDGMNTETAAELLAKWDEGETIWSIELGGLGPGYEQAIQVAAIEITREALSDTDRLAPIMDSMKGTEEERRVATEAWDAIASAAIAKVDDRLGGLSGAMYGAARWLAWQWVGNGGPRELYDRAHRDGKEDRLIQVSKAFPS